jgi:GNAT superfamily N-acetyltransferase
MLVRLATQEDVAAIMTIVRLVVPLMQAAGNFQWDETYPNAPTFLKDIENHDLWVVETEGEIAGFAALTLDQPQEYAHIGWDLSDIALVPHRMAVNPMFQGRGVAKRLLIEAEKVARDKGINKIRIDTNSKNQITTQLFPAAGYEFKGEIGIIFYCRLL